VKKYKEMLAERKDKNKKQEGRGKEEKL